MADSWKARRTQLDSLLAEARTLLAAEVPHAEQQRDAGIARCLAADQPGELLDLLDYHVQQDEHASHRSNRLFQQVAELQLSHKRDFALVHTLAEQPTVGTSVTVVTAKSLGSSQRVYAVKTITKAAALKLEGQNSVVYERDILHQATIAGLSHAPNLVAALHDATHLHLILEYLSAGDIGLLLAERKVLPLYWVRLWSAQTFHALFWLHDLGYAHRDIKPANILLGLDGHAKLADFASAGPLWCKDGSLAVIKRYCLTPVGTVDYLAPDILLAHERAVLDSYEDEEELNCPGLYTASVDFWSLGVAIYEMLTGSLPFYADTIPETYEKILQHEHQLDVRSQPLSPDARDLLSQLISTAEIRLTAKSVKKHPFFASITWEKLRDGPAPYKPSIRRLETQANVSRSEDFSKGFDFSALFSSPGLSILRNIGPSGNHDQDTHWLGFTLLPDSEAFQARHDDVARKELLPASEEPEGPAASIFPRTPARSSVSPAADMHSSNRQRQNIQALQEVVNYGIFKTARKATAPKATAPVRRDTLPSARPPSYKQEERRDDLHARHARLVTQINSIEARYNDLVNSYTVLQG